MHIMKDMTTKLTIYTGRYADPAIAGSGLVAVGITRYPPRFKVNYPVVANLKDLAPTAAMLTQAKRGQLTRGQFEAEYIDQIEKVGIKTILRILRGLQGRRRGVILLCYENVLGGERCHRRLLADWLKKGGGLVIKEYTVTAPVLPVAVGYCRISKAGDAKSVSIATQKAQIASYATSQGWNLVDVVTHDGVSGGRRSRFAALDAAVKENGARVVICYHLDRLARDAAALLDWCSGAARRGVALHVVGRGRMETSTSAGYLTVGVEGLVAAHYRLLVAEKTKGALAHLRSAGRRWTRTAPYGFTWTEDGRVVLDPVEQDVLTRVRMLRAGGATLWSISATLAAEGVLSRVGRPLGPKVIRDLVRRQP